MLKRIKVNLEAVEAMNYFWQAASEKENVSEQFFHDVGIMPAMTCIYNEEFNEESVRRTLSAIKNREPLVGNKKEKRFWNNNMWIMEDMEYKDSMIIPVKRLNLDDLVGKLKDAEGIERYEELEVVFSPMPEDEYVVKDNRLLVNFFRVKPSDIDDNMYINDKEIKVYIEEKLRELLKK